MDQTDQARFNVEAKENRVYWLCECGRARTQVDTIEEHCEEEGHIAEKIDSETGKRIGIIAAGFSDSKYKSGVPDNAQINRERMKNEPLFPR